MTSTLGLLRAAGMASLMLAGAAEAKTPGHQYCFHDTCHTVKTLDETRRLVGVPTTMKASFYDDAKHDRYNPSNQTSSGEYFRSDRPDNAASPVYPDGTKLLVWHPASRKALIVRINNAGPYWGDRKLDLSRAAAETFGITRSGVATVQVRVLEAPSKAESTYKRGRSYPPVKGYLGQFASVDAALSGVAPTLLAAAKPTPKIATVMAAASAPAPVAVVSLTATDAARPIAAHSQSLFDRRLVAALETAVQQEVQKFQVAQRSGRVETVTLR